MNGDELILPDPGFAMMQAPTPDTVPKTTAYLGMVVTGVAVWIIQRFLGAGAKAAIVSLLEPKFEALEKQLRKLEDDQRQDIAELRDAVDRLADRRNLPRPTWRDR